jgi:hypothetical protein
VAGVKVSHCRLLGGFMRHTIPLVHRPSCNFWHPKPREFPASNGKSFLPSAQVIQMPIFSKCGQLSQLTNRRYHADKKG